MNKNVEMEGNSCEEESNERKWGQENQQITNENHLQLTNFRKTADNSKPEEKVIEGG
jgi:hypothetical protein